MDSNVEFLIEGDVDYIKCEKITVKWECKSSEEEIKRKGEAKLVPDSKKITFPPSEIETLKKQDKIVTTRVSKDFDAFKKDEALKIPENVDYSKIGGLSNEIVTRLTRTKPLTIGAMTRMMGITPAAVTAVIAYLKKK
jgi:tRNA U34 5-carboxymethylaminomethyl modifying enzyme MnmG/GidA